jgi:starvation-inducible outer membrane lipoprotein
MKVFAIRLKPNTDLRESLKIFINSNNIKAGFILTAVGSLKQAKSDLLTKPPVKFSMINLRLFPLWELFQPAEFIFILQFLIEMEKL